MSLAEMVTKILKNPKHPMYEWAKRFDGLMIEFIEPKLGGKDGE